MYSPELLAHFRDPVNPGAFPAGSEGVIRGEAGSAAEGRLVRIELRLAGDGTIGEARFQAFGCPATIASASFAVSRIEGQLPADAATLSADEIRTALSLSDERREAGELAARAVCAATDIVYHRAPLMADQLKSKNITWSHSAVSNEERRKLLGHGAATVWFTGLSGSGKSTIAIAVEKRLVEQKITAYVLDGDNVRHGLNSNVGFSPEDRTENIRRIGEVSKLFNDAGVIVLTAFVSPYIEDRDRVREILPEGEFVEVMVDCPLEECEKRDVKGLYKKARAGEIPEFTGISAPYEAPLKPELTLKTAEHTVEECVDEVLAYLEGRGITSA